MEQIKCITFDKAAQDNLPKHIKDKMKADREKACKEQEAKAKTLPIQNIRNSACGSIRHKMMLAGIYKECPACGDKFKEADC